MSFRIQRQPDPPLTPADLPPLPPDRPVDTNLLVTGRRVNRYTEPARGGLLWVQMPCCTWTVRLNPRSPYGLVFCPPCRLVYRTQLIDEGGQDYYAAFEVAENDAAVARPRRKKAS